MLKTAAQKASYLFPNRAVKAIEELLVQGGYRETQPRVILGLSAIVSLVIAILFSIVLPYLVDVDNVVLVFLSFAAFLASEVIFYAYLLIHAENRAHLVESLLPDMLQIISANIRAGMTLENAIWSASKPEFGPLRDEINRMSADVFSGKPVSLTLSQMSKRVRSEALDRSIKLISEGIALGGEMANLLDEVANGIRSTQGLQKEINNTTMTYMIFIVFTSAVIAPVLFAISVYYSELNQNIFKEKISKSGTKISGFGGISLGKKASPDDITPGDFKLFAMACITITTFCAGLIIAVIRKGKVTQGLTISPFLMVLGLIVYLASYSAASAFLGGAI